MINVPLLRFQQFFGPLTMLLVQGYSEAAVFYIDLTTFWKVRNFGNNLAMIVMAFFEYVQNLI